MVLSRSPDQFRLSRLKEGERVCGGRGQFGKQRLWDLNTVSKLRVKLMRCGVFNEANWKYPKRVEGPVLSNGNVPEDAEMSGRTKVGTHV
jgi:hypothetical protein